MADDPLNVDEALLTPDEAAALVVASVDTLRKWRELRTGPAYVKLGAGKNAMVRYSRSDLAAWLKANRVTGDPDSPAAGSRPGTADNGGEQVA